MSRIWKEPYTLDAARNLRIRELEAQIIVRWDERGIVESNSLRITGANPKWIYYVYVCDFTFAFFSTIMMRAYLNYYSQKILPSRIRDTPHYNHDLRQDVFTRLPLYLREEPKRLQSHPSLTTRIGRV